MVRLEMVNLDLGTIKSEIDAEFNFDIEEVLV